ncbi:UNVERIFIED_CONTAM: hypothetical protein Sradi_1600500 [Sesamum radiatum]|uniref:Uncharacterized protein n=1 Tax=Sesamum radiatum TaxID=300843 RepID=A0AAW2UBL5_SESRA
MSKKHAETDAVLILKIQNEKSLQLKQVIRSQECRSISSPPVISFILIAGSSWPSVVSCYPVTTELSSILMAISCIISLIMAISFISSKQLCMSFVILMQQIE